MNKMISTLCIGALCMGMISSTASAGEIIDSANMDMHKIGVVVYNLADEQVVAFRDYLENYIEACFTDVDFLYSTAVNTPEQEMEFIQNACDAGVEGILSFNSYDLEAEVKLCEENDVYYMRASSGISDEEFEKVGDNPFFIGAIGPSDDMEYEAGYEMGKYFADQKEGDAYFITSGGAGFGVRSHVLRTKGMLDGLQDTYGVQFEQTSDELAASPASVVAEADGLSVCVAPGFLDSEQFLPAVVEAYEANPYPVVMSAYPISGLEDEITIAHAGVIDCYSEVNRRLFAEGKLQYVTGKFSSCIGPSFAAMYNAVTGYAEDFREDGKAFRITQGFWTSDSAEDFDEKFVLSSSIAINAYNYEDLQGVCKRYNPDASLGDLKALAEAYSFEEAAARRGL